MASQASTSTFPLALRAQPRQDESAKALPELIRRINVDRGHMRAITEQSLKEEIKKDQDIAQDALPASDLDDAARPADYQDRLAEIHQARMSLFNNVSSAHEQAMLALDFLSFLIKKEAPRQADQTMSPALKQMFPQGNLAWDKVPASRPGPAQVEDDNLTALGWNLQSLNKSADSLLESATKLRNEVKRETRYWDDVLSVRDQGWSICRVPRQKNALSVRFGFTEASPIFASQSVAVMKPDDEGRVTLDTGASRTPKALRVRLFEGADAVADSKCLSTPVLSDDISATIRKASDSLFEEELFYELEREAQSLLNYGVKIIDHSIHVPLSHRDTSTDPSSPSRHLVLTSEPVSNNVLDSTSSDPSAARQVHAVALSLRLLLTHEYRRRLRDRQRPPAPLSLHRDPAKTAQILRTLLSYTHHQSITAEVDAVLKSWTAVLNNAGLPSSLSREQQTADTTAEKVTSMEHLMAKLSGPWRTTHTLHLFESTNISLLATTAFVAPSYGSRFQVCLHSIDTSLSQAHKTSYTTVQEAVARFSYRLRMSLFDHIRKTSPGWRLSRETARDMSELQGSRGRRILLGISVRGDGMLLTVSKAASSQQKTSTVWRHDQRHPKSFDEAVKAVATV